MAQAVTYIAGAPKSNAAYLAIDKALADTQDEVPKHLRDTGYKGAKTFGHGAGYKYPHDFANHFVKQQYLPDEKISARYYEPTTQGAEAAIKRRLETLWQN